MVIADFVFSEFLDFNNKQKSLGNNFKGFLEKNCTKLPQYGVK